MKTKQGLLVMAAVLGFIALGTYSNLHEQAEKDRSKLPPKVEDSRYFQRWITNLKNKDIPMEADDFKLIDEVEIYNTRWMKVTPYDDNASKEAFDQNIQAHKNIAKVVFSPSEREYLDYRPLERDGYKANEASFYGLKDTKVIDMRMAECSIRTNCYFDRGYFLSNDLLVLTEFSRNIPKNDTTAPPCGTNEKCTYSVKLHLIDMINNRRSIYESKSFEGVLDQMIPNL